MVNLGYVALDILYAFAEDSGSYTCVVQNELGQAQSETSFDVSARATLYMDPLHEQSWQRIQELEAPKEVPMEVEPEPLGPPKFVEPLQSFDRIEGQPALFQVSDFVPIKRPCSVA